MDVGSKPYTTDHHSLITRRADTLGVLVAGTLVILFCVLQLWHNPLFFWNDDYEVSILPVFADVARSWSEGHWPLLSPYSWGCGNLAGEYQYGTFSVFVNAVVIAIWEFPLSFAQQAATLSIIHLVVLGTGGYLLARGRNLSVPLAIMVALVAALNGWIICWGATDWFGALAAFAWLPWAWWGLERALDSERSSWRFLWPAPFVYLLVTGAFPYIVLMLIVLAVWLAAKSLGQTGRFSQLWPFGLGLLLGFGLSSPGWLAVCDYIRGSAREMQDSSMHFQWLLPWGALPGLILPSWTVNWADFATRLLPHGATELACGLVAPIALLIGLTTRGRGLIRGIKWELGLLLLVLILSMVPSVSLFRWSFRWLPFLHVILALCGAEALRSLNSEQVIGEPKKGTISGTWIGTRPGLVSLMLVALLVGAAFLLNRSGEHPWPFGWFMIGIAGAWAILERTTAGKWLPPAITFATLLVTYLCIPANCGVPRYNLAPELTRPAPLDPQRLYLSIYPPLEFAYRIENKPEPFGTTLRIGSTSMWGGVHLLNGYSPVRPSGVATQFNFGIHGEIDLGTASWLLEQEAGAQGKLAHVGVDGIIVANELGWTPQPNSEWEVVVRTNEGTVFHRRGGILPRVRSVTEIDSRLGEQFVRADVGQIVNERNQLQANVTVPPNGRPALLTISRPYFNGYSAKLGTVPLAVRTYQGLIPTIEIPAGSSGRLTVAYRPWWLLLGGGISIASLAAIIVSVIIAALSRSRESTPP